MKKSRSQSRSAKSTIITRCSNQWGNNFRGATVALQDKESGKAPGIEGLPQEFLELFWFVVEEDLLEVLNDYWEGCCH